MPARINHNVHLKQIQRNLSLHQADTARQIDHLSSGLRINRSSDDPASLAQADGIKSELRTLTEGRRNIQQTFSLLQVADGALNEIGSIMIIRMHSLAIQAGSSVSSDGDRVILNAEFSVLREEIDRIAGVTTYNGKNLLTGFNAEVNSTASTAIAEVAATGLSRVRLSGAEPGVYTFEDNPGDGQITLGNGVLSQTVFIGDLLDGTGVATGGHIVADFDRLGFQITLSGKDAVGGGGGQYDDGDLDGRTILVDGTDELTFQVGPAGTSNDVATISISDMRATGPTLNLAHVSLLTITDAGEALTFLGQAQRAVIGERNRIASFQNRLEMSIETSEAVMERLIAAEESIRQPDLAKLVTQMSRSQILAQVATSMSIEADADIARILTLLQ